MTESTGRFKAEKGFVFVKPTQTKTGMTMGFALCEVSKHLDDRQGAAELIAKALNEYEK